MAWRRIRLRQCHVRAIATVLGGDMPLKVNTMLKKPGVFTVAPVGALAGDSPRLLAEKVEAVLSQNPDLVIFDMEFVDYINSMAIRVLLKAKKDLKQRGAKMVFVSLQPPVKKVFDILNALPSLRVFASVQELDNYLDAMQSAVR
jgi:anti-anti-sigma factor